MKTDCNECRQEKGAITYLLLLDCHTSLPAGSLAAVRPGDLRGSCPSCILLAAANSCKADKMSHYTCYRMNGVLQSMHTTTTVLSMRLVKEVVARGKRSLQNVFHTSNDDCNTESIFNIAEILGGCGFNYQFKLHSVAISHSLQFQKTTIFFLTTWFSWLISESQSKIASLLTRQLHADKD